MQLRLAMTATITVLMCSAFARGQNTTQSEREIISKALIDASNRLARPKCSTFFGQHALTALQSVQVQVAPVRPPLLRPGSNGRFAKADLIIATTQPRINLIIINRLGPFMEPSKPIGGRHYNLNLRDDEFRVVVLLHELGHLMDRFQAEGSYAVTNEEHTLAVVRHCS